MARISSHPRRAEPAAPLGWLQKPYSMASLIAMVRQATIGSRLNSLAIRGEQSLVILLPSYRPESCNFGEVRPEEAVRKPEIG
jgi:hypothetical protein